MIRNAVAITMGALMLSACGGAELQPPAVAPSSSVVNSIERPLSAKVGGPSARLISMKTSDGILTITLRATSDEDAAVAMWDGLVLARSYVPDSSSPVTTAKIVVVDQAGKVLDGNDASVASTTAPLVAQPFDETAAAAAAAAAGVTVRTIETYPESGGAVALTVSGQDAGELAANSSRVLSALVGKYANKIPTLVRFVDDTGAAVVTVGWIPLGGDVVGTGVGWEAPGVDSSAIFGVVTTG